MFQGISTRLWVAGLLAAMLLPPGAQAGIKCWTNKEGVRECGNAVPPEYAQAGHEEKSVNGLVLRKQARSKTPEEVVAERKKLEAEARVKAAADAVAAKQAATDRVLLDTFSSEDDLVLARDGQLTNVDSLIKVTESHVKKLDRQLDQMIGQAADVEKRGRPVPENLTRNIENVRGQILEQKQFITAKSAEKEAIRAKFDADIVRFRELRAKRTATAN
jgi:hypothetical protein